MSPDRYASVIRATTIPPYSFARCGNVLLHAIDGSYAESPTSLPQQNSRLEIVEFRNALKQLPSEQRESLILVGDPGFSYEETGQGNSSNPDALYRAFMRACLEGKIPL